MNTKYILYRFDSVLYQDATTVENIEPKGTLTDIASAIRETVQAWRGQPNAGIVLITDGAHNTSRFSVEDIAALNTPVYAIGVRFTHNHQKMSRYKTLMFCLLPTRDMKLSFA